jgi:NADP-dependent 3-hydroxy acid dehydrogenase YdfG
LSETAYLFSERGAKLVLAARSLPELQKLAAEIQRMGGQAEVVEADVSDFDQVEVPFVGNLQRLGSWHNTQLLAGLANQANLPDSDALVDSQVFADVILTSAQEMGLWL